MSTTYYSVDSIGVEFISNKEATCSESLFKQS